MRKDLYLEYPTIIQYNEKHEKVSNIGYTRRLKTLTLTYQEDINKQFFIGDGNLVIEQERNQIVQNIQQRSEFFVVQLFKQPILKKIRRS